MVPTWSLRTVMGMAILQYSSRNSNSSGKNEMSRTAAAAAATPPNQKNGDNSMVRTWSAASDTLSEHAISDAPIHSRRCEETLFTP